MDSLRIANTSLNYLINCVDMIDCVV
jgi:hypothetical protein